VQRPDGGWVPVDTTLSVQPDGSVAPKAITTGLSLSGGGPGPLYTLSKDGKSLSVAWPYGALPVPSLSGATATYADVLPGVNLLVTATPTGVSDLIEVMSAAAAASPRLAKITFPVTGNGVTVTADAAGNVTAADSTGKAAFTAADPQMWDSAAPHPGTPARGGATASGLGARHAAVRVSAEAGRLSLTPSAAVLSGPGVVYPVFIDPAWNTTNSGAPDPSWSDVAYEKVFAGTGSGGALVATSHWGDYQPTLSDGFGSVRSGVTCQAWNSDGSCAPNPIGSTYAGDTVYDTYRSFLNFPTPVTDGHPGFSGAAFADAWLQVDESFAWKAGCPTSGQPAVQLFDTASGGSNHATGPSTDWPGPAAGDYLDSDHGSYGDGCPAKTINLNATAAANAAANGDWPWVTLELTAASTDESTLNQWSWKRFQAQGSGQPVLYFYWRNVPDTPTQPGVQSTFNWHSGQTDAYDCSSAKDINNSSSHPDFVPVNNPNTFRAVVDDKDGPDAGQVDANFAVRNETGNTNVGTVSSFWEQTQSIFVASRSGTSGDEYSFTAYGGTQPASDGNPAGGNSVPELDGPRTSPCYFVIDSASPEAPVVTTNWTSSNQVGTPGKFTFSEPAGYTTGYTEGPLMNKNDVVGYLYGIDDSSPSVYVPASGMGGSATVTITPFTPSAIDLYVQAVGAAGNVSNWGGASGNGLTEYQVFSSIPAGNIAPLGYWPLNNQPNSSTGDASESLTMLSGAGFGCGSAPNPPGYKCVLNLPQSAGSSEHAATRTLIGADGSFSVSAWVDPDGCLQVYCAVLSQGAQKASVFTLGYQSSGHAEWVDGGGTTHSTQCPCWLISMPKSDTAGSGTSSYEYIPDTASSNWYLAAVPLRSGQGPGDWTQLTAVMDATNGKLMLYVNGGDGTQQPGDGKAGDGIPAATVTASPWSSAPQTGYFRVGADWTQANGLADYFDGSVSDACAFYGVLNNGSQQTALDVQNLYDQGPGYGTDNGDGCAVLNTTY